MPDHLRQLERVERGTLADYRRAARCLWGAAGVFAVDTFDRCNALYFDGQLPPTPIVIGLTAYGRCLGLTRPDGVEDGPRITLASTLFKRGALAVADTIVHEMTHVRLILTGENSAHNAWPWCREITRMSPLLLGHAISAAPVTTKRRVPGAPTKRCVPKPGFLPRGDLARWPHSCRTGLEDPGPVFSMATY